MFETLKVSFSLLSLKMNILNQLFVTLIYTMLSMFMFVKVSMHVLRATCKLWLSVYFNLFTPACVNLIEYRTEPVKSWITEAPDLFSGFETSCQRQFWLLEGT